MDKIVLLKYQLTSSVKITGLSPAYTEQDSYIVAVRATETTVASVQINDVRIDDEGTYKVEISVEFPGAVITAEQNTDQQL